MTIIIGTFPVNYVQMISNLYIQQYVQVTISIIVGETKLTLFTESVLSVSEHTKIQLLLSAILETRPLSPVNCYAIAYRTNRNGLGVFGGRILN